MPVSSREPFTVSSATPAADKEADPSDMFPVVKAMVPAGSVVPLAGFTVAVNWRLAVGAIELGLARRVMAVDTSGGAATVIAAVALDDAKFAVGS